MSAPLRPIVLSITAAAFLSGIAALAVEPFPNPTSPAATPGGRGSRRAEPPPPPLGGPLPGLTPEQQAAFREGRDHFLEAEGIADGLGPVFNGRSCGECHAFPAAGGSGPDLGVSRVTRIGRRLNGLFDSLADRGGSLLQSRSIRELDPNCPIKGEQVPPEATLVSRRITTPLFGAGLIDAIPPSQILSRADPQDRNRDGIAGVANMVLNPETGRVEVGRFGWKGHVPTLHLFAGDAYLNEMGITNPTFPTETLPQGQPIPEGWDLASDLEDPGEDVERLATYMRFLGAPPARPLSREAQQGSQLFTGAGCAACHVPSMVTGSDPVPALANRQVALYSDLLLHDMGAGLADGIVMGGASGRQWRTAPLWGLSGRRFFLHDGRTNSVDGAIRLHDGEAARSRGLYQQLSPQQRGALLSFLASL